MRRSAWTIAAILLAGCKSATGDTNPAPAPQPTTYALTVSMTGAGASATVTSTPSGIACTLTAGVQSGTCSARFAARTAVTLTSAATTGSLQAWGGACTGVASCAVTIGDATSVSASYALPPVAIITTSLAGGTVGSIYSATLSGSGGDGTYTWSLSAGTLPAGLTLNATSGAIAGTPTSAGTSNFTVQIASNGTTATKALGIVVTAVSAGLEFNRLATGETGSCGIVGSQTGTLYCWGNNTSGELGIGSADANGRAAAVLVSMPAGVTFKEVSVGGGHACAISTDGDVYCWGRNTSGQIGTGAVSQMVMTPVKVSNGIAYTQISAGSGFTCGVTSTREGRCWGTNAQGQLGDGTINDRYTPTVMGGTRQWLSITAGSTHACGLEVTTVANIGGRLNCWGRAAEGQIGDGVVRSFSATPIPVDTALQHQYIRVAAGPISRHTCGIDTGGVLKCWGANDNGQLGDGTTIAHTTPAPITSALRFNELASWGDHACAREQNGALFCWGQNISGELGDGTSSSRTAPSAVQQGSLTFLRITMGAKHTCALGGTSFSRVQCWGYNGEGQLGTGSFQPAFSTTPVVVKAP